MYRGVPYIILVGNCRASARTATRSRRVVWSRRMQGRHIVVTGGKGALGGAVVAWLEAHGAIVHIPDIATVDLSNEAQAVGYYAALPPLWGSIQLAGGFAMAPIAATSL